MHLKDLGVRRSSTNKEGARGVSVRPMVSEWIGESRERTLVLFSTRWFLWQCDECLWSVDLRYAPVRPIAIQRAEVK